MQIGRSFEEMHSLRQEWDRLVERTGAPIHLTFDWCRIWWKYYGGNRELLTFIFRKDQDLTGVVPMFVERTRMGPVSLRLAKLLVSDHTIAVCDPPVCTDDAHRVFESVLETLIGEYHCDVVTFGPISGLYHSLDILREACDSRQDLGAIAHDKVIAPLTTFGLPETFDDYVTSLRRGDRSNLRRRYKHIAKTFEISEDVVREPGRAETEFESFRQMHERQWETEGKLGHFADWPMAGDFHLELVRSQAKLGRLRLYRLLADGEVISYQYAFAFGNCLHWILPARVVGKQWKRFGLGRLALATMIERAIGERLKRIEAGPGHYPYKTEMGGRESDLRSIVVVSARVRTKVRQRLFTILAGALDLLYYRLYFARIAPKLPWRQGPLWRCWIRSRL